MTVFRPLLGACLAIMLGFCTSALVAQPRQSEPLLIQITRDGGHWQARYTLPQDRPVWALHRTGLVRGTNQIWRSESWHIETQGVRLERVGDFDAMIADEGNVPREVAISFTPALVDLAGDYDPAIALSNGSLALYTGHFTAFPMEDLPALRALRLGWDFPSRITISDANGPVLYRGQSGAEFTIEEESYVVFGPVDLVPATYVDAILDPGLPPWLSEELALYTRLAFDHYTARLGPAIGPRPTLFAAWQGPSIEGFSFSGSVSEDMMTLVFAGDGLQRRNYHALVRAQRFIAHETAHFWLGRMLSYETREDSWIIEGGATFLALRLQEALHDMNESDQATYEFAVRLFNQVSKEEIPPVDEVLADALTACPKWLAKGDLRGAVRRQNHEAAYDCGALFALAVEQAGARHGEDYLDFLRRLIAANPDETVTMDEWLDEAVRFGLAEEKRQLIRRLLLEGSQNGEADLARLLAPDP